MKYRGQNKDYQIEIVDDDVIRATYLKELEILKLKQPEQKGFKKLLENLKKLIT